MEGEETERRMKKDETKRKLRGKENDSKKKNSKNGSEREEKKKRKPIIDIKNVMTLNADFIQVLHLIWDCNGN